MIKLSTKITSLLIISLLSISLVFSEGFSELNLPNTIVNPGSFYYSFKRLWEKGIEKLQFSKDSKINFYHSQLKIKLAELNFVVKNKLLSEVQQSSERFAFQAGILTDELIKQNSKDKEKFIKKFEAYGKFLEKLRDVYPANTSFWMLIQHDINTLTILSERLK